MKTPEEIKKGLECCLNMSGCTECPYRSDFENESCDIEGLDSDTIDFIQQLEAERDTLMADLTTVCETVNTCLVCDHYRTDWVKPGCELNGLHCAWKWRGVKQ